jgi:phosphoserine/homoserine phosphotransferase
LQSFSDHSRKVSRSQTWQKVLVIVQIESSRRWKNDVIVTKSSASWAGILADLEGTHLEDSPMLTDRQRELPASEFYQHSPELTGRLCSLLSSAPLIAAFDLESVLVPEIWQTVSETAGVPRLALTTRDTPDFETLMSERMRLCRENGLTLSRLRQIVGTMQPLPGAVEFLSWVQERMLAVIVSDTYHELAGPVVEKLGCPLMVCNGVIVDEAGYMASHRPHHARGKAGAVEHFQQLGFQVVAVGDSHNDLPMLVTANAGILFRPCAGLMESVKELPLAWDLQELQAELQRCLAKTSSKTVVLS